jgi:hypothetical protein
MNKLFTILLSGVFALPVMAQTRPSVPGEQPYGKVDLADLEMKSCDFEKDANAEVLFNVGKIYWGYDLKSITNEVHKRIKIFNDNGKREADIRIEFHGGNHL